MTASRYVDVVHAGLLTTIQDAGRPGHAHLGVPRSGALDQPAWRRGNRLVGNAPTAAALEVTMSGLSMRTGCPLTLAVTGAWAPLHVNGKTRPWGEPVDVRAGAEIVVGPAQWGVRTYVALNGGVACDPVLGSRSTDTLSGLGPAPVHDGSRLSLGGGGQVPRPIETSDFARPPDRLSVRVRLGPRDDWFSADAIRRFFRDEYEVSSRSDRIGVRLDGPGLTRSVDQGGGPHETDTAELPSEGVVLGAVQVPADGKPLIFLADHPTTGGYPVLAVVAAADLCALAQARSGTRLRFRAL